MGFSQQWIKWMMLCVETVYYSVLLNGEKVGPIVSRRGLCQGDPLSPYLFIICVEGLSSLIRHVEARGDIHRVKNCKNALIISHLFFADDCFLFFRVAENEVIVMKNILSTYEVASGQLINLQKSEIFCSRNVQVPIQNYITHILGTDKYLGYLQ
jgi:hypothetical protein